MEARQRTDRLNSEKEQLFSEKEQLFSEKAQSEHALRNRIGELTMQVKQLAHAHALIENSLFWRATYPCGKSEIGSADPGQVLCLKHSRPSQKALAHMQAMSLCRSKRPTPCRRKRI